MALNIQPAIATDPTIRTPDDKPYETTLKS